MKKIILLGFSLGLLLFGGNINAQDCQDGKHAQRQEMMRTELGLTDTQAKKMDALKSKYRPQIKAIWEDESLDHEAKREKIRGIKESQKAEMAKILTPDQLAKMESFKAEYRHGSGAGSKGHGRHGGNGSHERFGGGHGFEHGKGDRAGIHAELAPIMERQRAKLENELSTTDKAALSELRSQMKAAHEADRAFRQDFRTAKQSGTEPTEAQRAQIQASREQRKAIQNEVLAIATKYQSQISALHEEVKPEVDAILAKAHAEHPAHNGNHRGEGKCEGKNQCEKGAASHQEKRHERMLVHFMLMDPNAPTVAKTAAAAAEGLSLTIFPNPSTSSNTLRYELSKDSNVKVELLNVNGQVIRVLDEGSKTAGTQELKVNLSDLSAGTYFFRITSDIETQQGRFSVTK